jgi:hypothetical protein
MTNEESHVTSHYESSACRRKYKWIVLSVRLTLRPTVRRPVCHGIKHPSGVYDQIFITVRPLRVSWCGAFSLTRGRVCRLQFLLVLASAVIFESDPRGTRDRILLSQIRDFPFRRLRLAGLRWRYSTLPPHGRMNRSSLYGRLYNLALSVEHICWIFVGAETRSVPSRFLGINFVYVAAETGVNSVVTL